MVFGLNVRLNLTYCSTYKMKDNVNHKKPRSIDSAHREVAAGNSSPEVRLSNGVFLWEAA